MTGTLSAAEAAALLGVKKATLYTYVSRGWIHAVGSGRSRRYASADVELLRTRAAAAGGHAAAASSALDWGAPILESAITSIDVDGPNYRGEPAMTLAERDTPFEAVAELLWNGTLPTVPAPFAAPTLGLDPAALAALLPEGGLPSAVLPVVVSALGARDPLRHGLSVPAEQACARILVRRMAAWLAVGTGPRSTWEERAHAALAAPSIAAAVTAALGGPASAIRWVNRALVCLADHELNASTFAARVAAGTGADPYAVVTAALATWSGPRHGGASEQVEHLLRAVDDPPSARRVVAERLRTGAGVPGFGQRLYPDGDPRAERLMADAAELGGCTPGWQGLQEIVRVMAEAGHPRPNVDLGLVGLCVAAGLPAGAPSALFAIGRTAGWLAHAWEQRATGRLLRPRARYVGR